MVRVRAVFSIPDGNEQATLTAVGVNDKGVF